MKLLLKFNIGYLWLVSAQKHDNNIIFTQLIDNARNNLHGVPI